MGTPEKASQESKGPVDMVLRSVGIIRSKIREPVLVARGDGIRLQGQARATRRKMQQMRKEVSEVVINEDLIDILEGIEQYSHLMVLYWAHKVPEQSRSLKKVHPMGRSEFPLVGIFCTCSPARPNPVLVSIVRLCGRKGNVLEVTGLDAVDASPVVDVKPYVKRFCPQDEVRTPEWMQRIQEESEEDKQCEA
jgi:tRNA-Thr(GGU) m(6)t(6)A37 methyltransferase TsaA